MAADTSSSLLFRYGGVDLDICDDDLSTRSYEILKQSCPRCRASLFCPVVQAEKSDFYVRVFSVVVNAGMSCAARCLDSGGAGAGSYHIPVSIVTDFRSPSVSAMTLKFDFGTFGVVPSCLPFRWVNGCGLGSIGHELHSSERA